jgi:hypothetical protein
VMQPDRMQPDTTTAASKSATFDRDGHNLGRPTNRRPADL